MTANMRETKHAAERLWSMATPTIIQVRVPVPFSLKWINSYILLQHDGTFTIVDPGLHTVEAEEAWRTVMSELSLHWKHCSSIIVTHQHPDHYGLAGYVQQLSGAPVYMTRESKAYTEKLWGDGKEQFHQHMMELLNLHGTPQDIIEAILENLHSFQAKVEPQPQVTYVEAGETLQAGDIQWQIIHTEGHAYGGMMLYNEYAKLLLCGDQVLPHITPHVGVVAGEQRPVLKQFLNNLHSIRTLDVELVLPGHRQPFHEYSERIGEIVAHHERRLASLRQYIEQNGAQHAFDCCEWMFGKHLRNNAHNMRFALTEVIAHLQYLQELEELVEHASADGIILYGVMSAAK